MFKKKYSVVRNANFFKLILASFISNLGSGVRSIALPFYVFFQTSSYLLMTLMMVINILPSILFSPYAGMFADRFNRKTIMVVADLYRAILFIFIFFFQDNLSSVFIFSFLMTFGAIFFTPCSKAILPEIVKEEELVDANAIHSALENIAYLIGPILGGLLIFKVAIIFDSLTFITSALLIFLVRYQPEEKSPSTRQKVKFIRSIREIRALINSISKLQIIVGMVLILSFCFAMIPVILPGYITEVLGFSRNFYGLVLSLMTLGGILGSLLVSAITRRLSNLQMFVGAYGLYGSIYLLLIFSRSYFLVGLSFIIQGIAMPIMGVSSLTIEQKLVHNQIRGKFFGVLGSIQAFMGLFGRMISGPVAQFSSPLVVFTISGSLMILGSIWGVQRLVKLEQTKNQSF